MLCPNRSRVTHIAHEIEILESQFDLNGENQIALTNAFEDESGISIVE